MSLSLLTRLAAPAATAVLVLTAPAAGMAAAAELPDPATTETGNTTVIDVRAKFTGETFTPKGGEAGDFPDDEEFIPAEGDAVNFTEDLLQDGTKVGHDRGTCTVVKVAGTELTTDCTVVVTFAPGTLSVAFEDTFDVTEEGDEGASFQVDVVGGTGAYEGARGTATVTDVDDEHSDIKVSFTTDQVAAVPSGGVDAGGRAGSGSDATGPVALGSLAAALGAALLLTAYRTARRTG